MNKCDFELNSVGVSDVGLVRTNNEDVWSAMKPYHFYVLADGMGGHKAGEVASKEAVRFVCCSIEELFASTERPFNIFELSSFTKLYIENANSWVHHLGKKKKEYRGMGTTLCSLLFHERSLIYGHVGDSRIYRLRAGNLEQITVDHSLKNQMIREGRLNEGTAQVFPYKNVLTRAIGTNLEVEAEIHIASVEEGDVYLMCTDGLSDCVSDRRIEEILNSTPDLDEGSNALVEEAKAEGGSDNITIVLVRATAHEGKDLSRQQRNDPSRSEST